MPPRPRPRPKAVAHSSPVLTTPQKLDASTKTKVVNDDDDDSFFIRNQGRSLKEVEQRAAKAAAQNPTDSVEEVSSGEDESDHTASEGGTPRPRRRSKKTGGRDTSDPGWISKDTVAELLRGSRRDKADIIDLSSEYDEDYSFHTGPSGSHLKRARSRSRSLTPPPELTEQEILRTRMVIKRVLESDAQAPPKHVPIENVMEEDDVDPTEEPIDPSLRHIIERVLDLNKSLLESEQASASYVTIRVKWIYPPDQRPPPLPKQWDFTVKKTDSLRDIAEKISQEMHVLPQELRLLYEGKHVYTTISPQGLGPWDKFELDACFRMTHEGMTRHFSTPPPQRQDGDDGNSARADSPTSEASADDADEKFKLIVRAANLSIPLSVRPTTTCGKIVKAFLTIMAKEKGQSVPPKKASLIRLYVDGEKQDPNTPISDCDLEDGDMVEVIGL